MEQSQKLDFQFSVLFDFYIFAIYPNFIIKDIVARVNAFIINLLLKILYMENIVLIDGYEFLKLY